MVQLYHQTPAWPEVVSLIYPPYLPTCSERYKAQLCSVYDGEAYAFDEQLPLERVGNSGMFRATIKWNEVDEIQSFQWDCRVAFAYLTFTPLSRALAIPCIEHVPVSTAESLALPSAALCATTLTLSVYVPPGDAGAASPLVSMRAVVHPPQQVRNMMLAPHSWRGMRISHGVLWRS